MQIPAVPPRPVSPSASADTCLPIKNSEYDTSCRLQDKSKSPAKSPIKSGRSSWRRPRPPGLTLGLDDVDDVDTEVGKGWNNFFCLCGIGRRFFFRLGSSSSLSAGRGQQVSAGDHNLVLLCCWRRSNNFSSILIKENGHRSVNNVGNTRVFF